MKIFYKKDFQRVLKELEKVSTEYDNYIMESIDKMNTLKSKNYELLEENSELLELRTNLSDKKDQLRKLNGKKGGFIKEINKLKKELEERNNEITNLRAEISDLRSDRYLIRQIPSDKSKGSNKTKIPLPMKSQVRKFMKENFYD